MKRFSFLALIAGASCMMQANACVVSLMDNMQLPLNSSDIGNSNRLSIVRHYLAAREWTTEGATVQIEAAAFNSENNPERLAKARGEDMKSFLVNLGMRPDDVHIQERIIATRNRATDPDDDKQIRVAFYPKCPPTGCQDLCNEPNSRGVVSYAVTSTTPGPARGSERFTCGDMREPSHARFVESELWTPRTTDKTLTLSAEGKPLATVCYRISTSAGRYIGMTDSEGKTQRMQLLGPERTTIEVKVDAARQ